MAILFLACFSINRHSHIILIILLILKFVYILFAADLSKPCIDVGIIAVSNVESEIRHFQVDPFNGFAYWIQDITSNNEEVIIKRRLL